MSGRASLVGGLGQHEGNGYLVLGVVEGDDENAMSRKNENSPPSFLLCSQSILLKVQL